MPSVIKNACVVHVASLPIAPQNISLYLLGIIDVDAASADELKMSMTLTASRIRLCIRDNFSLPPCIIMNIIMEEPRMDKLPEHLAVQMIAIHSSLDNNGTTILIFNNE